MNALAPILGLAAARMPKSLAPDLGSKPDYTVIHSAEQVDLTIMNESIK
jgi:hypothetical protein